MNAHMVERVRDFLMRDCDALAAFYEAREDYEERGLWSQLASDVCHMAPGLLELQASYLAQMVAVGAERLPTTGET